MSFTQEQLNNWEAYERVRKGGKWNMYDPRARQATGLERNDYLFVLKNYTELKEACQLRHKK
jgi:hypothetical protein